MSVRILAPLGAALALSACVVAPPAVVAVPGQGKDPSTFQADEAVCKQQASQAAYAQAGQPAMSTRSGNEAAWQRYENTYTQCMVANGDSVEPVPTGYGYGGYPYGYGSPYGADYGYGYGGFYPGFYGGFYPGFYGGFYPGFGFGYGGFGYGRFGYGFGGRFGYGGGFGGGFRGGVGGGFGGGFHGGGGHR